MSFEQPTFAASCQENAQERNQLQRVNANEMSDAQVAMYRAPTDQRQAGTVVWGQARGTNGVSADQGELLSGLQRLELGWGGSRHQVALQQPKCCNDHAEPNRPGEDGCGVDAAPNVDAQDDEAAEHGENPDAHDAPKRRVQGAGDVVVHRFGSSALHDQQDQLDDQNPADSIRGNVGDATGATFNQRNRPEQRRAVEQRRDRELEGFDPGRCAQNGRCAWVNDQSEDA